MLKNWMLGEKPPEDELKARLGAVRDGRSKCV